MPTSTAAADTDVFPYAEHADDQLHALLEDALAQRLTVEQLTRTQQPRDTDEKPGAAGPADERGGIGYGVQQESDWGDYASWEDVDDWEAGTDGRDLPIRFATRSAAQVWCAVTAEQEHRARHRRWQTGHDRWLPRHDLYLRRVQALKDAGLWTTPTDKVNPLLVPAGPGRPPRRDSGQATRYRVVPDAVMDTPIHNWELGTPTA